MTSVEPVTFGTLTGRLADRRGTRRPTQMKKGGPQQSAPPFEFRLGGAQAFGLAIPCIVSQLAKASNQPVLVVSLGYMPKPWPPCS
jgi:hypothetical protein